MPKHKLLHGFCRLLARFAVYIFIVFLAVSPLSTQADTSQKDTVSRLIHVVYDDSNSMIMYHSTAWSEAKYSLEILSAMMQEKDTMNVYFMSDFYRNDNASARLTNLSGAEAQRQANIQKIHNTVTDTSGTYFASIRKAYEELKSKGSSYDERHLVVITDGNSFNGREDASDLNALFGDAKKHNIKVIYLAIGEGAIQPAAGDDAGIYVYEAVPNSPGASNSILNKVAEIGERIFQRPAYPVANHTLELKIPVSEIVIFAQGDEASVGDLPGTRKMLASAGISAADRDKASLHPDNSQIEGIENIVVAEGLQGVVATFRPAAGEYIPEGSYSLSVTASSYQVYYKPCLDVVLEILDKDGAKQEDGAQVNLGSYTANYFLTYPRSHPQHGKAVDLAGLNIQPAYTLQVNTNGQTKSYLGNAPQTIELTEGSTKVTVTAQYLTYISTDSSINFAVMDLKVYDLKVTIEPDRREYLISELDDSRELFTVRVTHPDGTPLSSEEWELCQLSLTGDGIDFSQPAKQSDGTFTFRPLRKNGNYTDTAAGDIPFVATATITQEGRVTYKGSDQAVVNVYNDVVPEGENGFQVKVVSVSPADLPSGNFNASNPQAQVEITWNGNPLTKEQYEALSLSVAMKQDFLCKDGNGSELPLIVAGTPVLSPFEEGKPTQATISFAANGDGETQRTKLSEYDDFVVTAVIDRMGVRNETATEASLLVDRTWSVLEIIGLLIALALILSYLPPIKRYLPWRITYYANGSEDYWYPYAHLLGIVTLLIPGLCIRTHMDFNIATRRMPVSFGLELTAKRMQSMFPGKGLKANVDNFDSLKEDGIFVDARRAPNASNVLKPKGSTVFVQPTGINKRVEFR